MHSMQLTPLFVQLVALRLLHDESKLKFGNEKTNGIRWLLFCSKLLKYKLILFLHKIKVEKSKM